MAETRSPIDEDPALNAGEAAPMAGSRWQVAGRALRHRNFQLFFSGQLISLIGTWMQSVAQSWLVYRLTGSALLLGTVGFASQIPGVSVGAAGRDRGRPLQPPRVVIGTQVASMLLAFILAALTLARTKFRSGSICAGRRCSAW